jgi:hypothetical protein
LDQSIKMDYSLDLDASGEPDKRFPVHFLLGKAFESSIISTYGIACLRLVRVFIAMGACFEQRLTRRLLQDLLDLCISDHLGEGPQLVVDEGEGLSLPAAATFDLRGECASQMIELQQEMLIFEPPSTSDLENYLSGVDNLRRGTLSQRPSKLADEDTPEAYTFAEHITRILSILSSPPLKHSSLARRPMAILDRQAQLGSAEHIQSAPIFL